MDDRADAVQFTTVDPASADAVYCLTSYYRELHERFDHGFDVAGALADDPDGLRPPAGLFVVARLDGDPIGCGGLKFDTGVPAYIKRMWISPTVRGQGVGRRLLAHLETLAGDLGHRDVYLETNRTLSEAIRMYVAAGYEEIAPFNDEPYAHHWYRKPLDGYVSGPAAATEATTRAVARVGDAASVILVEGISDQIAIETLAIARGLELRAGGVAVVPTGGAHAIGRFGARFATAGRSIVAMCDIGEERVVRSAIARADVDATVFVCNVDLEDELIRAVTPDRVQQLLDEHGNLRAFRTLQRQAVWRDQPVDAQLRRYLASGATRKLRYAEALVLAAVALDRVPATLQQVIDTATA